MVLHPRQLEDGHFTGILYQLAAADRMTGEVSHAFCCSERNEWQTREHLSHIGARLQVIDRGHSVTAIREDEFCVPPTDAVWPR